MQLAATLGSRGPSLTGRLLAAGGTQGEVAQYRLGGTVLSLMHAAGGAERNWSTHGKIFADDRQRQTAATLERNVRMFRNMRLRDHTLSRGKQAKKDKEKEPKE